MGIRNTIRVWGEVGIALSGLLLPLPSLASSVCPGGTCTYTTTRLTTGTPGSPTVVTASGQNANAAATETAINDNNIRLNNLESGATVAAKATALAANGANCTTGLMAQGVDTLGAAEGCTDVVLQSEVNLGAALWLNTPSSANLRTAVANAAGGVTTGTGALVFAQGGTLTNYNLGTPATLTLTNATGLQIDQPNVVSGNLDISHIGPSLNRDASHVLRGDGAWVTPGTGDLLKSGNYAADELICAVDGTNPTLKHCLSAATLNATAMTLPVPIIVPNLTGTEDSTKVATTNTVRAIIDNKVSPPPTFCFSPSSSTGGGVAAAANQPLWRPGRALHVTAVWAAASATGITINLQKNATGTKIVSSDIVNPATTGTSGAGITSGPDAIGATDFISLNLISGGTTTAWLTICITPSFD